MLTVASIVVDKIPDSIFLRVAFWPIAGLIECFNNVIKHKHFARQDQLISAQIILGITLGILLPLIAPAYHNAFDITPWQPINIYISIWVFTYPPSGILQYGTYAYLKIFYDDHEYYLSRKRLHYLEQECHIPTDDLLAVFNFLRATFRSKVTILHAGSSPLDEVLDEFMYGEPTVVAEKYYQHRGFYDADLLMHNDMHLLEETQRMDMLATRYNVDRASIQEVLRICVTNLYANLDVIGGRKEDYAEIIRKILSGSPAGNVLFLAQQRQIIMQKQDIERLRQNNIIELENLRKLEQDRKSPRTSPKTSMASDDAVFGDAVDEEAPIDREALAMQVLQRERSAGYAGGGIVLVNQKISDADLAALIAHLEAQLQSVTFTLHRLPPLVSERTLQPFINALEICAPSATGSMECFKIQRPSTEDYDAPPVIFRPSNPSPQPDLHTQSGNAVAGSSDLVLKYT